MSDITIDTTDQVEEAAQQIILPQGYENAEPVVGVWKSAAEELDNIRRGLGEYTDDAGRTKKFKLPRHIVQEQILVHFTRTMKAHTQLYVDAYPYVFIPSESRIYKFHNNDDAYALLSRMRLFLTQTDYSLVQENFAQYIQMRGEPTRVEKLGNYRNDAIYVNNGRGGMLKISERGITDGPNGLDGVLMLYPALLPLPQLTVDTLDKMREISQRLNGVGAKITPDSKLCKHLNALFEESDGVKSEQYQQLVLLRYLSLFVGEALMLRPLMLAIGEQNSGKSTLWEKIMWILEGPGYESGALPSNLRSFTAAITNNPAQIFDNIDSVNFTNSKSEFPQYIDLMCKSATGGKIKMAELYKTNVDKTYELRCDIFLTARVNPFPSDRSDLLRRTLIFPFRKPEQHEYITVETMKREMTEDRDEIMLETLIRLRNILRAMKAKEGMEYPPVSEMHSFETWTMKLADHEGWAEDMKAIWVGYRGDYQNAISEDSTIVEFSRRWLGSRESNKGRWVRVGEMYRELADTYHAAFTQAWRNDKIWGRRLKENFTALRALGIEKKRLGGYTMYRFNPNPIEWMKCLHSFTDSASRIFLGDSGDQDRMTDVMSKEAFSE